MNITPPKGSVIQSFAIFSSPLDFPGEFVCRRFDGYDGRVVPGPLIARGKSIEEVRAHVPVGLFCFQRTSRDVRSLVETWM